MTNRLLSRRQLLKTAGALAVAPLVVPGSVLGLNGAVRPSDRIVLGAIGIGPRGTHDLGCFLGERDVQFVAICDVRAERREFVKKMADDKYANQDCKTYRVMHDILARPDIDAVLIATGDRWHSPMSIIAAKAGKDIYCEKPCSITLAESRALSDTVRRYGRIYQAGTQRRRIENFEIAVNLARSGKLGKLHTVHANTLKPGTTQEWLPAEPEPSPEVVDYKLWLGACPWRPYNSKYVQGRWRGYWDFHGGGILEWGAHTVNLCQWANDADDTAPVEYQPDGAQVLCRYANGVKLVMRDTGWTKSLGTCAVRFEGDAGWVETADTGQIEMSENLRSEHKVVTMKGTDASTNVREFLDSVKSRKLTRSNATAAAQTHIACHAAYIAWQLGRKLSFDPAKDEFIGDAEANRMRSRSMREPWRI